MATPCGGDAAVQHAAPAVRDAGEEAVRQAWTDPALTAHAHTARAEENAASPLNVPLSQESFAAAAGDETAALASAPRRLSSELFADISYTSKMVLDTGDPDILPEPTPYSRRDYEPSTTGLLYPAFEDDRPFVRNGSEAFFEPAWRHRPGRRKVPQATPPKCDPEAVAGCAAALSSCLAREPTDVDGVVCPCYGEYAKCYRDPGCFDLLPRHDVRFCTDVMHCRKSVCMASGAFATSAVGVVAAAAVILAAFLNR